jgi:hypothetical protein
MRLAFDLGATLPSSALCEAAAHGATRHFRKPCPEIRDPGGNAAQEKMARRAHIPVFPADLEIVFGAAPRGTSFAITARGVRPDANLGRPGEGERR